MCNYIMGKPRGMGHKTPKKRNTKNIVIISVIAIICYLNTLDGTFVFDDTEAIVKNNNMNLNAPWLNTFRTDFWGTNISSDLSHKSYRPLTTLFYRTIIYLTNTKEAYWFHFANVALYIVLCTTFYALLKTITRDDDIILMTSALYTSHPIHSEVVSSVVGSADLLSGIMFFIGLCLYIKASERINYVSTAVCALTAMLFKETGITLLGVCSVYDFIMSMRNTPKLFTRRFIKRQTFLGVTTIILLFLRYYIIAFKGPKFQRMDNPASFADNILTRVLTYSYIYFMNFLLMFWPQWLCFDWAMGCIPLLQSTDDPRIIYVFIFYVVFVLLVVSQIIKRRPLRLIALSLLIVPFLPASNIFLRVGFVVAERTLLLPSAGFCLLVVCGYKRLCQFLPNRQKILTKLCWVLCVLFTLRSHQRAREWVDEHRLFNSAVDVCPLNAKVHYNIAKVAVDRGDVMIAELEYRTAILLHPEYDQAMNNLANLLRDKNELMEAKELLERALEIRSDFAAAWMNLGIVWATLDDDEQAEKSYMKALQHRKRYPDCYYNLGNLYLKMNKHDEALEMWQRATELRPSHTAAWSNYLVLLDTLGHWDSAVNAAKHALHSNPMAPTLYFTIANTLGKMKQWKDAELNFRNAIQLSPTNAIYHSNLGVLYHRWGKIESARRCYKDALRLNPGLKSASINLRRLH